MVKPYYQDSAVTIYHGDCREIVPQLGRFDLLLTDAIAMDEGYAPRYYQCDGMQGKALFTGKVNPELAEWLMGWPQEWTNVLSGLAMDKFHAWQQRHGTSCAKEPPPEHC